MVFFLGFFTLLLGFTVKAVITENPDSITANVGAKSAQVEEVKIQEPVVMQILPLSTSTLSKLSAEGVFVAYYSNQTETPLLSKNEDKPYLLASVSKLMTAILADNLLPKSATTSVSKFVLNQRGATKKFPSNSTYEVDTLMRALLVESNNDAAWMLAEKTGSSTQFALLMNQEAKKLGMTNTTFENPTGIDPTGKSNGNTGTAKDIAKLISYIYKNESAIAETTILTQTDIPNLSGSVTYVASSTNALLKDSSLGFKITAQKTGETPLAKQNLALVLTKDGIDGYFVTVVLKSKDHFADTKTILKEIENSLSSNL